MAFRSDFWASCWTNIAKLLFLRSTVSLPCRLDSWQIPEWSLHLFLVCVDDVASQLTVLYVHVSVGVCTYTELNVPRPLSEKSRKGTGTRLYMCVYFGSHDLFNNLLYRTCCQQVSRPEYRTTTETYTVRVLVGYYYYSCGWWGWSRCRGVNYR